MTHEFKNIVAAFFSARAEGLNAVLATVVDLDGSSYRKPGVQMLVVEDGSMIGAVSGGCVEKDIARQSETVFMDGKSRMMTYDGRYRLGCEGILYILLEIFQPNDDFLNAFNECLLDRNDFVMNSWYEKKEGVFPGIGTYVELQQQTFALSEASIKPKMEHSLSIFTQKMPPCFKLIIFGAEHDAVQLCRFASLNGWEVAIVTGPLESKAIGNFPSASKFYAGTPDSKTLQQIDNQTAVVLMTHNFANDLKFLIELKETQPVYLGLLGPSHRRERLFSQFLEYCPEIDETFINRIHGPAGLNIGAETPQEIAISILSEILSVVRDKQPILLKEKSGGIHA